MKRIINENKNLWLFLLFTFTWSWIFWILRVLESHNIIPSMLPPNLTDLLGVFGPTLAAIILTSIVEGKTGLRELLGRILLWRVHVKWYIFVLFFPAVISILTTGVYIIIGGSAPDFANPPFKSIYTLPLGAMDIGIFPLVLFAFLQQTFLGSSMGEEVGWRGYALPRLLKKQNALYSSVILGLIWGIWHLPRFFIQGYPITLSVWFFFNIIMDTILFTWIYNNTKRSLPLALLFHSSISYTSLILSPAPAHPLIEITLKALLIILILQKGDMRSQLGNE